jgi:hypothetical protein
MTIKRVLVHERVRRIPAQFSWLDHRLVRDRHIERCDAPACALYLFLVTVADAQGLSYYSEASLAKRLSLEPARLGRARADLVRLGLIAYESPLYQVLALDVPARSREPSSEPLREPSRELSREQLRERFTALRARLGYGR